MRQPLQRPAGDRLLVAHRDQDHSWETGRIRLTVPVRVVVLGPPPLVELERQRGGGDQDHEDRDDEDERVGEQHRRQPGQHHTQGQPPQPAGGDAAVRRMLWTRPRSGGERPVLVRAEIDHAADDQQAPVGDGCARRRSHDREQGDAEQQAPASGELEPAPPAPEAHPGVGNTPPPGEAAVRDEVELQGGDRLDRVGDPGGTSDRDEQLQQPVTGERDGATDQGEQPLLPAPESRKDSAQQSSPSVLGPLARRSPHPSTVTAREHFSGASGDATGRHGG